MYALSLPAEAEIEEGSGQYESTPGYYFQALSNQSIDGFLDYYLSELNNPIYIHLANHSGLDDALIPGSVWSIDTSTGVHFDSISDGYGADAYAIVGTKVGNTHFWTRTILGLQNDKDRISDLMVTLSLFQVASCGGNAPEHHDLDRCDYGFSKTDQISDDPKAPIQANGDDTAISSNNNSELANGLNNGWTTGPAIPDGRFNTVRNLSPQTNEAPFGAPDWRYGHLAAWIHDLISPIDDLADLTEPADISTMPIDSQTAPIIGLTLPPDLSPPETPPYVGSGSDWPPLPPSKPISEASTWVMTITGFGIMVFVFGKKRRSRTGPIPIVDGS